MKRIVVNVEDDVVYELTGPRAGVENRDSRSPSEEEGMFHEIMSAIRDGTDEVTLVRGVRA
jgi:hypothetical protein